MALTTMYEGMNNSPQTNISAAITASDTVIPVSSVSVFPTAPNLATLGTDENAEVIRYNGIDGNTLTGCERGFGGSTASPWPKDTVISRQITKYDLDTLRQNVLDLENRKLEAMDTEPTAGSTKPVTSGGIKTALDTKQDILTFDDVPTSGSSNPVKSSGIYDAFEKEILYFDLVNVSASSNAQIMRIPATGSDSRITDNTVLLDCTFSDPSKITSDITWNSYSGYITFSGTCTSATTAKITLGTKGN